MKKAEISKFIALFLLVVVCFVVSGCGETIKGLGNDARRVGRGFKTIFIRDSGR